MEAFAVAIEGLALAEWLRFSRWGYAAVNASHILGIALLVGANLTLDLRLLGAWRSVKLGELYRVLSSVSAGGLVVAIATGALLFSVRATEYVLLELFFLKVALIIVGAVLAASIHFRVGIEQLSRQQQQLAGFCSLLIWLTVLGCGRLLAFL